MSNSKNTPPNPSQPPDPSSVSGILANLEKDNESEFLRNVKYEMTQLVLAVGIQIRLEVEQIKKFVLWLWPSLYYLYSAITMVHVLIDLFLPKSHVCIDPNIPDVPTMRDVDLLDAAKVIKEHANANSINMPEAQKAKVQHARSCSKEINKYRHKMVAVFRTWYSPLDDCQWQNSLLLTDAKGLITRDMLMLVADEKDAEVEAKRRAEEVEAKRKQDEEDVIAAEAKRAEEVEAKRKKDEEDVIAAEAKRAEEVVAEAKRREDIWKDDGLTNEQLKLTLDDLLVNVFLGDLKKSIDTSSHTKIIDASSRLTRTSDKQTIVSSEGDIHTSNKTNESLEKSSITQYIKKVEDELVNKGQRATDLKEFYMNPLNNIKPSPSTDSIGATVYGGGDLQLQKQCFLNVIAAVNKFVETKVEGPNTQAHCGGGKLQETAYQIQHSRVNQKTAFPTIIETSEIDLACLSHLLGNEDFVYWFLVINAECFKAFGYYRLIIRWGDSSKSDFKYVSPKIDILYSACISDPTTTMGFLKQAYNSKGEGPKNLVLLVGMLGSIRELPDYGSLILSTDQFLTPLDKVDVTLSGGQPRVIEILKNLLTLDQVTKDHAYLKMDSQKRIYEWINTNNLQSNLLNMDNPYRSLDLSKMNIHIPFGLADNVTFPNVYGDTPMDYYKRLIIKQTIVVNYMKDGLSEFVQFIVNENNNPSTVKSILEILDTKGNPIFIKMPTEISKTKRGGGGGGGGGYYCGGRKGGGGGEGNSGGGGSSGGKPSVKENKKHPILLYVRTKNSTEILERYVYHSCLNGDVVHPKAVPDGNHDTLNVVVAGAKFNPAVIKKIAWNVDTNKWGHDPNNVDFCDAVRANKMAKFTNIQFFISKENNCENPEFKLKNKIMNCSMPRAWIERLKEGGELHEFLSQIDHFEFEGNHCPGEYFWVIDLINNHIITKYIKQLMKEGGSIIIPGRHDVCDKLIELMPNSRKTYLDDLCNKGFTLSFTTFHSSPWYLANQLSHIDGAINRNMQYEDEKLYVNTLAPLLRLTYSSNNRNNISEINIDSDDETIDTVTENEIEQLSNRLGGFEKILKYTYKMKNSRLHGLPRKESISSGSSEGPASKHSSVITNSMDVTDSEGPVDENMKNSRLHGLPRKESISSGSSEGPASKHSSVITNSMDVTDSEGPVDENSSQVPGEMDNDGNEEDNGDNDSSSTYISDDEHLAKRKKFLFDQYM